MADVLSIRQPAPSLQEAVDAFLAQPDLAPTSRRHLSPGSCPAPARCAAGEPSA